jgi:hypothetical protein
MGQGHVTVVAVQVGNYLGRGAEYVNCLHRSVEKCITVPHRFVCVTDDPTGLRDGIETLPADDNAPGWWQKICLFRPGRFKDADRILFIDLDTIILRNIDDIASYDGGFAGTGNFRTGGPPFSSCMMAWQNGTMHHLYTKWIAANRPMDRWGDDEWIRNTELNTAKLNRIFPGIRSYKYHHLKDDPGDARVVIFMARPKPHTLTEAWVREAWRPE